ncbi:DUF6520 family protein [Soonwooa purpurea]
MKRFIIPSLVLLLGSGAAFAMQSQSNKATHIGYRLINQDGEFTCEPDKNCTDINNGVICTWSGDGATPLRKAESPTMCVQTLYEILP